MPKSIIKRRGGTQRSWDREVGYGTAPDWYKEDMTIEHEYQEVDISKLMEKYNNET